MEIVQLFKNQSVWTYDIMGQGVSHNLIPEEETLTDMNLLAIAANSDKGVVVKTERFSKHYESQNGADWEWHLINKKGQTVKFLVQAKRLYPKSDSYESLAGTLDQCSKLIDYADTHGLTPLYVFYNYLRGYKPEEVGCAVLGAHDVQYFIEEGDVSYGMVGPEQKPWFNLVDGVFSASNPHDFVASVFDGKVTPLVHEEIPTYVSEILAGRPVTHLDSGAKSILIISES